MPICKNREYRMMLPLTAAQTEKRFDSDYYVEGFATTFNKPYELYEYDGVKYYEMIDRHALDGADMTDVIMQFDHSGKVLARNKNNTLGWELLDEGFFIFADLSKSESARSLYEEIENELVTKMSWAFVVSEDEYNRDTRTRIIKKVKKVYDVSAVSIPANSDTDISARSYFDGLIEVEKLEKLEQRKKILKLKLMLED